MAEKVRCYECDNPTPKEALVYDLTCDCCVTQADCTHGVCPDCIDEIMDDEEFYDWDEDEEDEE